MRIITAICLILFVCHLTSAGRIAPATMAGNTILTIPGEQWRIIFDDEFTENHLDPAKWTIGLAWIGDDGTNRHHNTMYASSIADDDVVVAGGMLDLLTRKVDTTAPNGAVYHYTEGFIQTDGKFSYQYGYCEIRAQAPADSGIGLWPAVWLQDHGWPPEDDVAEFWTGRPAPHFHQGYAFRGAGGDVEWNSRHWDMIPRGWHTYGMEWGPGYQIMNMDGQATKIIFGPQVTSKSMYLMLNSGVTSYPPPNEKTVFPNSFLVDYVRVYSRPPVVALHDGDFEAESVDPWWRTRGDASLASSHAHSGQRAIKLAASGASVSQRVYGLKLNTTYQVSAWVAGGPMKMDVEDYAGPEQSASASGGEYRLCSVRFTTSRYVGSALLRFSKTSGDEPGYVDDVSIEEVAHGR
jgi:beta-glucanase (GH16 family)